MPVIERRRDALPSTVVVPVPPSAAPEESADHEKPNQHEEQNREAKPESPRSMPAVRVGIWVGVHRWRARRRLDRLPRLGNELLRCAVAYADVICDHSSEHREEQNPQHCRSPAKSPATFVHHSYLLESGPNGRPFECREAL